MIFSSQGYDILEDAKSCTCADFCLEKFLESGYLEDGKKYGIITVSCIFCR